MNGILILVNIYPDNNLIHYCIKFKYIDYL